MPSKAGFVLNSSTGHYIGSRLCREILLPLISANPLLFGLPLRYMARGTVMMTVSGAGAGPAWCLW